MAAINIASWIDNTSSEGPGKRFALWTQGCLQRCEGCCNPHMQELIPKTLISPEEFFKFIVSSRDINGIEGVTFIGGEPMLQAKGFSVVAKKCKTEGLSVMIFSGYTLEYLKSGKLQFVDELLEHTDILVDGPFMKSLPESERNWAGSTNQKFHYLTDFYKKGLEYDEKYRHSVEIRVNANRITINGWPVRMG